MPDIFEDLVASNAHRVLLLNDRDSGLRAIIALDDVTLGPGCGGIRTKRYPSTRQALIDVQKLAGSMTLKCAIAGVPAGGAKTVVLDHDGMRRTAAFQRLGRYIEDLGGLYRCAGDLGTTLDDLLNVAKETDFVDTTGAKLGEATGITIVNCMRAMAEFKDGKTLKDLTVAVQGCGLIGAGVARLLAESGARVIVADMDDAKASALAEEIHASAVSADEILFSAADIVSPCAVGGVITADVADRMKAWAICGGANNQLADEAVAAKLAGRAIDFMPDYLSSSGALIDGVSRSITQIDPAPLLAAVYTTAHEILDRAKKENRTTTDIGLEVARERLERAKTDRRTA